MLPVKRLFASTKIATFGKAFLFDQDSGRLPVMTFPCRYKEDKDGKAS